MSEPSPRRSRPRALPHGGNAAKPVHDDASDLANGSFRPPGRRKIWVTRTLWLLLIAWCVGMVFLNPWLLMVPGTLAAVLALLMPTLGVSFDDLLGRPQVRGGKVTIHPSGIRIAFVVILCSVLAGPFAVMQVMRGLGPVLGWMLTAIASALVIAGTVSYWRRRAIVVDAHQVYLQGLAGALAQQCDRARVDRITVDYGSIAGYGLSSGLVGEGAMRLRSADGTALLTIPLEFFTTREGIKLAHLLAVPIVTADGHHVSGMR